MTTPISTARDRLRSANLYLIISGFAVNDMGDFLARVLDAGVDMVQLRDKQMEAASLLRRAEVVRARSAEFGALFIVNDRVDVAIAAGADGVHLGQDDLPVEAARAQLGGEPIIGLSTHAPSEIDAAKDSEADYIGVGPVWETPTKKGRPAVGLDLVSYAARSAAVPFFAIGGIDLDRLPSVISAGARRVSVLRAITDADDPAHVTRGMKEILRQVA